MQWLKHAYDSSARFWIVIGYIGFLAIAVLSVVPGSQRPHTGAGGTDEHFVAYALVAAALGIGYRTVRILLICGAALSLSAALLEILQSFIPGRNAEIGGFIASFTGAWTGIVLSYLAVLVLRRL